MNAPQQVPTGEVLAVEFRHVRETCDRIEAKLDKTATKEELGDLRDEVAELRATTKILWDDRTATRAIIGLVGLIGVGNLFAIARMMLGQQ